jgi:PIN domain nuclease of toxin-antitoxin system
MILFELEMLYEKGAIVYRASQILSDLSQDIGLSVCQLPFASVVKAATVQVNWTREPGDRLIVANAIANNRTPLVTSDRNIHANYDNAIW